MLTLSKPPPREAGRTPQARPGWPARSAGLLTEVDRLLRAGRTRAAVDVIGDSYLSCPWTANALAVCHLRLGNTARALRLLRHIATDDAGRLRQNVPSVFRTNLAAALMAAGDVTGGLGILDEIGNEDSATVHRLRAAASEWAASLTPWERCLRWLGVRPERAPAIDAPVGELGAEPTGGDVPAKSHSV